ncbi:hypothetical protein [Cytobacillus gottheilii]|uniref:hypothetical protein n=1 Tax=Cytobacillus gottheilii TaxID=859144 RepID=UPI002495503D|nr:hypothetical protein [Cytobacillus gottheilii]
MKQCLIYTKQEIPANHQTNIETLLNSHKINTTVIKERNNLEDWPHYHDASEVSLIIIEEDKEYLENVLLMLFEHAFVVWMYHKNDMQIREQERIKICETIPGIGTYLKAGLEKGIAKQEFKRRVVEKRIDEEKLPVEVSSLYDNKDEATPAESDTGEQEEINKNTKELVEMHPSPNHPPNLDENNEILKSDSEDGEKEDNLLQQENHLEESPDLELMKEKHEQQALQFQKRSRSLQKHLFTRYTHTEHKMIGIWSPLHQIGVTTFTLNFALFLDRNRFNTTVLEGLTENHALKNLLNRYSKTPKNWVSYAKAIHQDSLNNQSLWTYKNVKFLPLDHDDMELKWDNLSLESYMNTPKIVDITLVDLPTGKMSEYTIESLKYLDEIWILVKDGFNDLLSWQMYIEKLKQSHEQLPFRLIFNQAFSFSPIKRLKKDLPYPIITKIPSLHKEAAENNYKKVPLYEREEVASILDPSFIEIAQYLYGEDFQPINIQDLPKQKNWVMKLLKRS